MRYEPSHRRRGLSREYTFQAAKCKPNSEYGRQPAARGGPSGEAHIEYRGGRSTGGRPWPSPSGQSTGFARTVAVEDDPDRTSPKTIGMAPSMHRESPPASQLRSAVLARDPGSAT